MEKFKIQLEKEYYDKMKQLEKERKMRQTEADKRLLILKEKEKVSFC